MQLGGDFNVFVYTPNLLKRPMQKLLHYYFFQMVLKPHLCKFRGSETTKQQFAVSCFFHVFCFLTLSFNFHPLHILFFLRWERYQ